MKKEFNKLQEVLFIGNTYDSNGNDNWAEVHGLLVELGGKIDEVEKRIECAVRSAKEINELISKYTEEIDDELPIKMSVNDHDLIQNCSNDVDIALDMGDDMCIVDNWYYLFSPKEEPKPIAVGNIEYDFPEEVYTIGNADNSEIIADVYESVFIKLCDLGLIWCEDDERFPIVGGNETNYIVKDNALIPLVIANQIDLSKVPIKREVFMSFESSWGHISCDKDGNVIEVIGDEEYNGERNYLFDIAKFDLVEYGKFCESKDIVMGEYGDDILSVGFWNKDNTYNEADHDWRKEIFAPTMLCADSDKHEIVNNIISQLKEIEVDGETMEYIIKQVGMGEQMFRQMFEQQG